MAWTLFKRKEKQTEQPAIDYSSQYDSDFLIPYVKSADGAIAGLKTICDHDELTDAQKTNITNFLSENKDALETLFKTKGTALFYVAPSGEVQAATEVREWVDNQLGRDDLPDGVSILLNDNFITRILGDYVEEDIEPTILHRKTFNETEKEQINDFLDKRKGQVFTIINGTDISTHEKLAKLEEWVLENASNIKLSDASKQFLSDPHILLTLQKTALSHELALAFNKVYASGDNFNPTDLIRGVYEQEHPDTKVKLSDDDRLKLTKTETHRFLEIANTLKREQKDIIAHRINGLASINGLNPTDDDDHDTLEKEAKVGWKEYIANRSTTGSGTFGKAKGQAPVGDYTAPDNVVPKAHAVWFYQGLAKLHYSNWGTRLLPWGRKKADRTNAEKEKHKFVNRHINLVNTLTGKLAGIDTIHILHLTLPRMFTGRIFGRPLIKDIDTSIEEAGLIDPIKALQKEVIGIAFEVEQNRLSADDAKVKIGEAYDNFADKHKNKLANLEFNTQKRLNELEEIVPEDKYTGKEGFTKNTKESALHYVQDINWMAINLARKGKNNGVLQELLSYVDKIDDERDMSEAIEYGTIDRLSRMGSSPEMRLAGLGGNSKKGLQQPMQSEFYRLERTLDVGTYIKASRFTKAGDSDNSELYMGQFGRYHENLKKEQGVAGSMVKWDVEAVNEHEGMLNYLYEAKSEHEAGRALRNAIMRMGRSADKTVSQTLTTKLKDQITKYAKTDPHRSQWARRMLTVQLNVPDSPFKYGGRHAWSMMFGLAEFFSVGWAYAAENRPGLAKKVMRIRQGGLPAKAMWNNLVRKKRNQFKAYISGRVLEKVPSEKNDFGDPDVYKISDSNLVDDDGNKLKGFAKTRKTLATVAGRLGRDAIWRPLKALSTGGIASSKHIFWAHVIAAEITAVGIAGMHAVEAVGVDIEHPSYVNALEVGTTLPRLAWDNTVFAFSDNMDFNTMVATAAEAVTTGGDNLSEIWDSMGDGSPDSGVEAPTDVAPPPTIEYTPYRDTPDQDLFDNTGTSYSSSLDTGGTAAPPPGGQDLLFEGGEFNSAANGAVDPETGIAIETDDDIIREEPDQDLFSLEE